MAVITMQVSAEDMEKSAKGGGGKLPIGQYRLRVESKSWDAPKSADKFPTLVTKCQVLQSFNGQNVGKTITRRFNMHPKSIPYNFARFCKAAGIPHQFTPQGAIMFDDDHVLGVVTDVECSHRAGENRTFEEWENDTAVDGTPPAMTAQSPQLPQGSFAPPQGGWAPPPAAAQPPQAYGPPQGWAPPQQQAAPVQQPQYAPPQQQYAQPPAAPNGNGGPPAWMTPGQPAQPQNAMYQPPQQPQYGQPQAAPYAPAPHLAGQGQPPPRGQG